MTHDPGVRRTADQNRAAQFRRHARDAARLPAVFRVGPTHRAQVRITDVSGKADDEPIGVTVVDVSTGGFGWESPLFLPRGCRGTLRLQLPTGAGDAEEIEHEVEIRRVRMSREGDRYSVGASLSNASETSRARIEAFLARRQSERDRGGTAA